MVIEIPRVLLESGFVKYDSKELTVDKGFVSALGAFVEFLNENKRSDVFRDRKFVNDFEIGHVTAASDPDRIIENPPRS